MFTANIALKTKKRDWKHKKKKKKLYKNSQNRPGPKAKKISIELVEKKKSAAF